ncbi:MAG: hypothetical protein ACREIV_12610, partial [Planctomycetaceae bacterium]
MSNVMRHARAVTSAAAALALISSAAATPAAARQDPPPVVVRLVAEPAAVAIKAGEEQPFRVVAYDARGNIVTDASVRVGGPRMA